MFCSAVRSVLTVFLYSVNYDPSNISVLLAKAAFEVDIIEFDAVDI